MSDNIVTISGNTYTVQHLDDDLIQWLEDIRKDRNIRGVAVVLVDCVDTVTYRWSGDNPTLMAGALLRLATTVNKPLSAG